MMTILLWIVFPFAIWSACMDQFLPVAKPSHTPKEFGGWRLLPWRLWSRGSGRDQLLAREADEKGIDLVFEQIAVTGEQIADWNLPTREPKRKSTADKKWLDTDVCR